MATNKYISQLTGSVSPSLSGYTIYDDGIKTYKLSLNNLKNVVNPGESSYATTGSNTFIGNQLLRGNLVISGSLTAQQFIVSSSVTHITNQNLNGSSMFGNSMDDIHLFTGSVSITGSLHASTLSGDGSGLTNLSNITGSVDKLAFISSDKHVNSFDLANILNDGETIGLGTTSYNETEPERLIVDNNDSFNIATFQTTKNDSWGELNVKNLGSGQYASADLVLWNDVSTEENTYVDLGINSSNYTAGWIGYGSDGYLYTQGGDLYIGSTNTGDHGHLHLFGGNLWQSSAISIYNDGTIGINTDKYDNTATTIPSSVDGYAVEVSGSMNLNNDLNVDGSVTASYFIGDGSQLTNLPIPEIDLNIYATTGSNTFDGDQIVNGYIQTSQIQSLDNSIILQPYFDDSRSIEIYNTSPSDIHIKGNATYTFFGDDSLYVKLDKDTETIVLNTTDGIDIYGGNTHIHNDLTIDGVIFNNEIQNNGQDLNIKAYNTNNIGLWAEGGFINITGSLNVSDSVEAGYFYGDGSGLTNLPIPSGAISSYSQLTGSFDSRYILSGSITSVPSGTISGSLQITNLGFATTSSVTNLSNSVDARLDILEASFITGSPNYVQILGNQRSGISAAGTEIVSGSITTKGNPIQVIVTGDANPTSGTGQWCKLSLYRDGSAIGNSIQVEAANQNENQSYTLNFIDVPSSGTHTYSLKMFANAGTFQFGEVNGPVLTMIEMSTLVSNTGIVSGSNISFDETTLKAPYIESTSSTGDEGGEFHLAFAATNNNLTGSYVVTDIYQNKLRIFEGGGNSRGVSIDLSKAPNGVGGELLWKASGLVNAGTFVTLDNIKATVTTSGQRGLSLATVSGTINYQISGTYGMAAGSGVGGTSAYNVNMTTTPSNSLFGWGFGTEGDTATYHILDKTNSRFYRITMQIGSGYINNFISIERLY